ncbi:hypothetical protein [Paenibacillus sp. FSL R10-2734]|uniref:hypothetical protein n=1 Tax=Paenibacillus sp. FSL R10-2734 TaxID=2954691 RepID=UPI0030D74522
MPTVLEQMQAAAKAKLAAGQSLAANPVSNAPKAAVQNSPQPTITASKAPTPTVATPRPTTNAVAAPASAVAARNTNTIGQRVPATTPATAASITRAPTVGTIVSPATKTMTPTATSKTPAPSAGSAPATAAAPNTNYVAKGGQTLNDILYLKKEYESGKKGAAAYATPSYAKLDPTLAAKVKGMNASQLEAYINGQNGQSYSPEETAATETVGKDYNALAQAAYDRELAAMLAGAQSQETELNRRYAYTNGVNQDNRAVQDYVFNQNNAPSDRDRSTNFRGAQIDRNRSVEDHYTQEALTDATAAAYSQANAFRNQSGNYIATKAAELENADKQYNLQVAGLTGVLNGQQTMQGKANDASVAGQLLSNTSQELANKIAQIDLSTYPQQSALKLQQLQQQIAAGKISNDTAAYQFTQLTDPNSATNQAQALDLQMKQIDASNYSQQQKLQLEQLRKTVAEIGKVPYQSDTDARLDQLKVLTAEAELQKLQETAAKPAGKTYEDYQSNIEKIIQRDKKGVVSNPSEVEEYILTSGLSDYEQYRAIKSSGLKWPEGVPVPTPGE